MTGPLFLASDNDVEVLLRQVKLLEWIKANFKGFVGPAVLVKVFYKGTRFETRHLDRATVLGPELSEAYPEWRRKCIKVGASEDVRKNVSDAVARLLVGHEEPFIKKIEQKENINDVSSVPILQLRAMIARHITQANCPQVEELWNRLSAHYNL